MQNNLQFFSNSSSDNPVVVEVNNKIELLSNQKEALSEKANAIKSFIRSLKKQEEADAVEDAEENEDE